MSAPARETDHHVLPAELYRRVFTDCPDHVALSWFDDGTCIDVNPGFQAFSGYSRDEAVGRSSLALGIWPSAADHARFVAALDGETTCHGFRCSLRRRCGELRSVEMSASLTDIDGRQLLVTIVRDITDRLHAETELTRHRAQLEDLVAQRTDDLLAANRELAAARRRLVESEQQARFQAQHDSLTGLPNRALLHDRVQQAISRAERGQDSLALLVIDFDDFKHINDTLGHRAGDEVLSIVAERLSGCVRKADTVARLGGDKFVVALGGPGMPQHAASVAHKIAGALAQPLFVQQRPVRSAASVGVAIYPTDGTSVDSLIQAADTAMNHAKSQGRDKVQFHSAEMQQAARSRFELEGELHQAIAECQFVLHYQPQVDMRTGEVLALEALVRWQHPTRGMVPPLDFIALAEETGLIVPLGDWVLREACRALRRWRLAGHGALRVAVNLSPRQIWTPGFIDTVRAALAEHELPGDAIDVEITESLLIRPTAENVATLEQLAALGLRLYIDDFGTGYSSLSYLNSFPIHALKIDRSFVRNITEQPRDLAITGTIIGMARQLQLQVIAEGVETPAQARVLLELGCVVAQGYHYGRPMGADAIDELLARRAWVDDKLEPCAVVA